MKVGEPNSTKNEVANGRANGSRKLGDTDRARPSATPASSATPAPSSSPASSSRRLGSPRPRARAESLMLLRLNGSWVAAPAGAVGVLGVATSGGGAVIAEVVVHVREDGNALADRTPLSPRPKR